MFQLEVCTICTLFEDSNLKTCKKWRQWFQTLHWRCLWAVHRFYCSASCDLTCCLFLPLITIFLLCAFRRRGVFISQVISVDLCSDVDNEVIDNDYMVVRHLLGPLLLMEVHTTILSIIEEGHICHLSNHYFPLSHQLASFQKYPLYPWHQSLFFGWECSHIPESS